MDCPNEQVSVHELRVKPLNKMRMLTLNSGVSAQFYYVIYCPYHDEQLTLIQDPWVELELWSRYMYSLIQYNVGTKLGIVRN